MSRLYDNAAVLGAAITEGTAIAFRTVSSTLTLIAKIDNGAGGPPTDTPAGKVWTLYVSDRPASLYAPVTDADVVAELANIAPNGNNVVVATASITSMVPGTECKLLLSAGTGGAGDSRLTLDVLT